MVYESQHNSFSFFGFFTALNLISFKLNLMSDVIFRPSSLTEIAPTPARLWKDFEQCLVFIAPGLGMLIGHFPLYFSIQQIGAYRIMAISLAVSTITTALMPFSYELGEYKYNFF